MQETKQISEKPAVELSMHPGSNCGSECNKVEQNTDITSNHRLEIDIRDDQGLVHWDNKDSDQGQVKGRFTLTVTKKKSPLAAGGIKLQSDTSSDLHKSGEVGSENMTDKRPSLNKSNTESNIPATLAVGFQSGESPIGTRGYEPDDASSAANYLRGKDQLAINVVMPLRESKDSTIKEGHDLEQNNGPTSILSPEAKPQPRKEAKRPIPLLPLGRERPTFGRQEENLVVEKKSQRPNEQTPPRSLLRNFETEKVKRNGRYSVYSERPLHHRRPNKQLFRKATYNEDLMVSKFFEEDDKEFKEEEEEDYSQTEDFEQARNYKAYWKHKFYKYSHKMYKKLIKNEDLLQELNHKGDKTSKLLRKMRKELESEDEIAYYEIMQENKGLKKELNKLKREVRLLIKLYK